MFTALVSPQYAERNGQATTVAGGFIAHGLVPPHRDHGEQTGWFYALLPGRPDSVDPEHVRPFPADQLEAVLLAERDRYLEMAQSDGDAVWADAAAAIGDMIGCLHRAQLQGDARYTALGEASPADAGANGAA
ncbi:hypothetical protein [Halorhodospira halophila]|uniref:Uncharacterized protein n=1 Tax=Halorhodospira halophila (strain DSM 244 / SL1) TaxID=349124 RepID=A1WTF8_HALHL|nr:hypothetical protein [Halorhodospira halophila]ABM60970.1 hypothetical protein Hhal_0176 [Halorhodospira halophila SL1]MBK1728628.1 hypothetical protein [Halorhodospira halophila]